jgi:hyperosmotically inducible periplasmic protein
MRTILSSFKKLSAVFALALAGLVAITSAVIAEPVGVDTNSTVSGQVRHKLNMLPWYGVFDNLQYQLNGSEVILSGQVVSDHSVTKDDAEKAVEGISGVTKVVNNIQILPLSPFDDQIRRAEYRAIFSTSDLGRYTLGAIPAVHIVVDNGHVTLYGKVMNQLDRNVAAIAANTVPGVFSVTNNLQVGG